MATALTFYGLVKDIERMLDRQESLQVDLLKLSRTYPSLARDERFKRIQQANADTTAEYRAILAEYGEMNRAAETAVAEPVDYYAALSRVVDTDLQETGEPYTCKHPTDSWVEVVNVPAHKRQYTRDDKDWLCSMCGLLVPPF